MSLVHYGGREKRGCHCQQHYCDAQANAPILEWRVRCGCKVNMFGSVWRKSPTGRGPMGDFPDDSGKQLYIASKPEIQAQSHVSTSDRIGGWNR